MRLWRVGIGPRLSAKTKADCQQRILIAGLHSIVSKTRHNGPLL
jgi:hypothetical protein